MEDLTQTPTTVPATAKTLIHAMVEGCVRTEAGPSTSTHGNVLTPALAVPLVPAATTARVRALKKKVAPRAIYKTSSVSPDPLGATSDDETIIMRLNVCTKDMHSQSSVNKQVEPPDAYNAVEAVSLVGNHVDENGPGLGQGHGIGLQDGLLDASNGRGMVGSGIGVMPCTCSCTCGCMSARVGLVGGQESLIPHMHGNGSGSVPASVLVSVSGAGTCTAPPCVSVTEQEIAGTGINTGMKVVQLLAEFDHKSRNSEWPSVTSVSCYWCCHPFTCAPVGLPLRRSGDVFHVMGCFCSLECAAAYNFGMPRVSVDRALERFMLINSLASKLGVGGGAIKPAPDRLSLNIFGGPLSIKEFRDYRSTRRHVIINQPPMLTLMQQVEEVDERDMKSAYSYIPLDIARVEKFQEKVRLRRTRPLVDPKNTLDQCMKLRYGPEIKAGGQ